MNELRKRLPVLFVLFTVVLMMTPALVQVKAQPMPDGQNVNARIMRQNRRIDDAVASGVLPRRDAFVLRGNLERIKSLAGDMRAANGGPLLPEQRARLERMLDRNSAMIDGKIPPRRF